MKKVIKITRTPLDGVAYVTQLIYKDGVIVDIDNGSIEDAIKYDSEDEAEAIVDELFELSNWKDYWFEVVDEDDISY